MADSHWEIVNGARDVNSNTPQDLWKYAAEYFKWCDDNPVTVKRTLTSGKDAGRKVNVESPRPYSIKALCLHCNIMEEWLRDIRQSKDKTSDFYIVVSKILYIIFIQNLEYATIGVFNPIFTAKVLNMEKDDTPTSAITVNIVDGIPELSKSENEILEKLELENRRSENDKEQKF